MAAAAGLNTGYALVENVLGERFEHLILELVDAARAALTIDPLSDKRAAVRLDELLSRAEEEGRLVEPRQLRRVIEGREALVVMAGDCIDVNRVGSSHDAVVIAADGATSVLLSQLGTCPDVIVTDLDGIIEDLLLCSELGSIVVVHAHGDNVWVVESVVNKLARVAGSIQYPLFSHRVMLSPGFTDGDRAVWLALVMGARRVSLIGWCPDKPQHPLSKRLHNPYKARKLAIAEAMLRLACFAGGRLQAWCEDPMGGDGSW